MLYLSREINEKVMVGDDIEVKVMRVEGRKVILGFKAPKKIAVHREEIYKINKMLKKTNDDFYSKGEK